MGNTLGTIDLEAGGNLLTNETYKKNANMENFPIPLSDSTDAQTYDFSGASATLSLRGQATRSSVALLMAAAKTFRSLISGGQSAIQYSSTTLGDGTVGNPKLFVKVQDVSIDYEAGIPLKFNYTIECVESVSGI